MIIKVKLDNFGVLGTGSVRVFTDFDSFTIGTLTNHSFRLDLQHTYSSHKHFVLAEMDDGSYNESVRVHYDQLLFSPHRLQDLRQHLEGDFGYFDVRKLSLYKDNDVVTYLLLPQQLVELINNNGVVIQTL